MPAVINFLFWDNFLIVCLFSFKCYRLGLNVCLFFSQNFYPLLFMTYQDLKFCYLRTMHQLLPNSKECAIEGKFSKI